LTATGTLEKCALHELILVSTVQADGRQRVWSRVDERLADINIVDRVPHRGDGVMVWAGIGYGQQTLNAQRYRDEILRPIVIPFICRHHLMFQHDNAQPHVARIILVILWIDVYHSVFQLPLISRTSHRH
jgi:hypothetical protein